MLVSFHQPLVDLRPFWPDALRLDRPWWPNPLQEHFVRGFGHCERRQGGGVPDWIGEQTYCKASSAIPLLRGRLTVPQNRLGRGLGKLLPYNATEKINICDFRCHHRRLFADGEVGVRIDVGFVAIKPHLIERKIQEAVQNLLRIPVRTSAEGKITQIPLCDIGKHLADTYARSTTPQKSTHQEPNQQAIPSATQSRALVRPGSPLAIIHWNEARGELVTPIKGVQRFRLAGLRGRAIEFTQINMPLKSGGSHSSIETVYIRELKGAPWRWPSTKLARDARVSIVRLHAERECLRTVVSALARGELAPPRGSRASDALQKYLLRSIHNLARMERTFAVKLADPIANVEIQFPSQFLGQLTMELHQAVDHLRALDVRRSVWKNLEQVQPKWLFAWRNTVNYVHNEAKDGSTLNVGSQVVGNILKDVDNFHNSAIQNIEANKSQKSDDLKSAISDLKNLIDEGIRESTKHGKTDAAKSLANEYGSLVQEATTLKRKRYLELSKEGLVEAAQTVAALAIPIGQAVERVLSIIIPA